MPGNRAGQVPSYLPFLLILLVDIPFFPINALDAQRKPGDPQSTAPLQTGNQTIQEATQDCLTPSAADLSNVQTRATSTNSTIVGNVVPEVRAGKALLKGRMPGDFTLRFELVFKLRNPDRFWKCLASVSDPSSPNYRHFLNATTLQPYLPTPGQKASIVSFLSLKGMTVTDGASPLVLEISAPVRTVEEVFGVRMNVYLKNASFGFYAADSDPIMPQNFASILGGILGLENYTRPMPTEYPCSGPYCPQGIQKGYSLSGLYSSGYDGTGQKVAIVDAPGDPNMQTAVNMFDSQYSLASTTLDIRFPDGTPSSYDPDWASETAMDVEAVHSMAPRAGIILLYDTVDLMNAIDYVATNHLATIVSNSWDYWCGYWCSDTQLSSSLVSSVDWRLALDASQGLTILFASGDEGAKPDGANFGTEFPASDPNVLAVGATNLVLSGCSGTTCSGYGSESGARISGGGYSGYFSEPTWQTSSIGPESGRGVPDVSMLGYSPMFWVYSTASDMCGTRGDSAGWFGCTGTSLSTPLWAGFLGVALQVGGGVSFGNIDPLLYQLGASASYSSIFHDVTSGSNGYSAGTGWDPVTGWGAPIASSLATSLSGQPKVTLLPTYGPPGTNVAVSGSSFAASDTACTISSSPSGLVASSSCTASAGLVSGSFTVASDATGVYAVTVTGNVGDSAQAQFLLTPRITLTPISGPPWTVVSIAGSGFAASDTSCIVSSSPSGLFSNPVCAVSGGIVSGSFTVAPGASVSVTYTVTVRGSLTGDVGSASFTVTPPPTMSVSYSIVGGGSPTAPVFHYVLNRVIVSLTLSETSKSVSVDAGSIWSVTPNPLGGSTSSQGWYSNQPLTGTASSTTLVFTFYHQMLQTLSYSVSGGGSPTAPSFTANQFGSSFGQTLTTSATSYWYDYGSSWTVAPNPLSSSGADERWFTAQATSGKIAGSSTLAFKYQHQFYLTMQLTPLGSGTVYPSSGWYNSGQAVEIEATAKTGYKFLSWSGTGTGSYSSTSGLTMITMNSAITETANYGVLITVTSNPTGAGYVTVDGVAVRTPQVFAWVIGSPHTIAAAASPVSCGTGCQYVFTAWSDGDAQSHAITVPSSPTIYTATFQKQTLQTLSYSVSGGGSGYSSPTFRANQFGLATSVTLTSTPTGYWFDYGSAWTVTNPLGGSGLTERWFTTQSTTGKIAGSSTLAFKYQRQYYLTIQMDPSGAGYIIPSSSGWYNAGQRVTIWAAAKTGYKFLSWTGIETETGVSAGYSGQSYLAYITSNAPITETANFGVIITITSNPTDAGYVTVDGAPVRTPITFAWVIGSKHTIAAVSPVSCGTGCQYAFTAWTDGGAQSDTIKVSSSPTTYKATFQKQYLLTMNVNPSGGGSVAPTSGWYPAAQKITLTATPNTGYAFKSWIGTGSGSYTGTITSPTITMNSAITETCTNIQTSTSLVTTSTTTQTSSTTTSTTSTLSTRTTSTTFSTTPTTRNTTTTEVTTQTETTTTNTTLGEMTTQTETTTNNTTTITEMTPTETTTTNTTSGSTTFTSTESGTVTTTSTSGMGVAVIQFLLALDPLRWILR